MMSKEEHPLEQKYREWSPRSEEMSDRARQCFPGGDTRASAHYTPYPLTIIKGEGCRLYDVDGHELIDFMNNFTSLIHGHAHPEVVKAVSEQMALGSAFAAPSPNQIDLAELIVENVPSVEQLRFCSSGSEATLMAIRCARAYTGKQKIMKMEGGYHGSYELAEVSLVPFPDQRGPLDHPVSLPLDKSIPDSVLEDTVVCPFNEPELAKQLICEHADQLAAVIVEPILGGMGMISATKEFLQALREECTKQGVILIFDEVVSLRLSAGGAQTLHGILPDLTTMGKIIGGGLPVGAIGGKQELLQVFNPDRQDSIFHASTFSGNTLTMAAGFAAMSRYPEEESVRLNQLGDQLREGFNQAFQQSRIRGQAIGCGSLINLHLTDTPLKDVRESLAVISKTYQIGRMLHLGMLRRGIFQASRLMYCISTPMGKPEIELAITALHETLAELRPFIENEQPELLV